jgi:hypothetical protein
MPSIPGSSTGVPADAVACGGAVVDGFAASTARRSDLSRCLSKASTPEQTAAPAPSGVRFPTLPLLPFVVRLTVGLGSGPVPLLRGPAAVGCEGRS